MTLEISRRSRENTRARLIDAAIRVFADKGYSSCRIDDVVKAAGFTRGAFYSNFDSLDELFVLSVSQLAERTLEVAREAIAAEADLLDEDAISRILERIRPAGRDIYLLNTEFALYAMRHSGVASLAVRSQTRFSQQFVGLLQEIFDRLGLVPQTEIHFIADSLILFFYDSVVKEQLYGPEVNAPYLLKTSINGLIAGLAVENSARD